VVGPITTPDASPDGLSSVDDAPKSRVAAFLSTTLGKLVVGGAILLIVLGLLAVIGIFYLGSQMAELDSELVVTQPGTETTVTAEGQQPPSERPAPQLEDTFVFRNIFAPTVKPSVPASETSDSTTDTADAAVDVPADTLYLQSISVVDGEEVATFIWNGTTYTAGEGDDLGDTPWRVLEISGTSVVMLYGDTRVTLSVGQLLGK